MRLGQPVAPPIDVGVFVLVAEHRGVNGSGGRNYAAAIPLLEECVQKSPDSSPLPSRTDSDCHRAKGERQGTARECPSPEAK